MGERETEGEGDEKGIHCQGKEKGWRLVVLSIGHHVRRL
jgi:hypothetical protein